jgi:polyhydroxyalkanoate synthesis regulator phasin
MTPDQQQQQSDTDAAQSVLLEQLLSGVQELDQQVTDLQDKLKRKEAQTQRQNWAAFWHKSDNHMAQSVLLEQLQSEVQHLRRQLVELQGELKRKNAHAEREKWAAFWHG